MRIIKRSGVHIKALYHSLIIIAALFLLCACTPYDFDQADTPANRTGFERHFGFPVPASVTDLYYFADELGVDVLYQLGFKTDQQTVDRIVTELNLSQKKPDFGTSLARNFDWWDNDVLEDIIPYWRCNSDADYYWFLWYDPDTQRAYYIEYSL